MTNQVETLLRPPELSDKEWVQKALMNSGRNGADFCFGSIFMWAPVLQYRIAEVDGLFLGRAGNSYSLPAGEGNPAPLLEKLMASSEEPLRLHGICNTQKAWLEEQFPGRFQFTEDRINEDYIYSVEALATLSGKKYHGKRNHCTFFEKNFSWSYEPMDGANALEALAFSKQWMKDNPDKLTSGTDREFRAIERALPNFEALEFVGGVLRVDGKVVAYTFGEPINDTVFCCHVEKADSNLRGAYPMINREFARNSIAQYRFVNREEDMGIEGLRKAKLSYHPVELLVKYRAVEIR